MTITERIFAILSKKAISQKEFSRKIAVNEKTVSAWKKNNSLPPLDKISKISDCLGVSIYYLLTGEEKNEELQETESKLVFDYRSLNEEGQRYIQSQISLAKKLYKNQNADD